MEVTIKGEVKEIAALVLTVQGRQSWKSATKKNLRKKCLMPVYKGGRIKLEQ